MENLSCDVFNDPFPHLVIDNFCDTESIRNLYSNIPEINTKSRDYMFANNKFEKSNNKVLGPLFEELNSELHSEEMNNFLSYIAAKEIFVDPKSDIIGCILMNNFITIIFYCII